MARHRSSLHKKDDFAASPKPSSAPFQPRPFADPAVDEVPHFPASSAPPILDKLVTPPPRSAPIQPKLTIGEPGDRYEQEADRVASQVVRQIHAPHTKAAVQRESIEADELQMKPDSLQRNAIEDDEELQMRPTTEAVDGGPASESLEAAIHQARGSGQALDPNLQRQMGQAMGADFSGVTIHADSQSDQMNQAIHAKAFTTGQDIFFRQGAYQPSSQSGQELIAHELTHTIQQGASAKVQRKTGDIANLPREVIHKQMIGTSTTEDIQKAIDKYNKIKDNDEKYDQQIAILDQIVKYSKKWLGKYEKSKPLKEEAIRNVYNFARQERARVNQQKEKAFSAEGLDDFLFDRESRQKPVRPTEPSKAKTKDLGASVKTKNTIKFNFAGSREQAWKTHKEDYANPSKTPMDRVQHESGGMKYSKKQEDKQKVVFEYAGPLAAGGTRDSGANSTLANFRDAQGEFNRYMELYMRGKVAAQKDDEPITIPKVQVDIKGFSRGAATASTFAKWLKTQSQYKDNIDVNVVLIDPVHGTGGPFQGHMASSQDVSSVYDKDSEALTGSTWLLPVTSGHAEAFNAFTPQRVRGMQRVIIAYGKGAKHSFGLGEKESSMLKYNGKPLKGMKLSTLPHGLFVVDGKDMEIKKVNNKADWDTNYAPKILGLFGDAKWLESRGDIIRAAVAEMLK
ncbi:MAG: hypothetical protein RLZZ597_254 [Cyanobacteriota bacterium]|jgi:hypothetical protein